MSDGDTIRRGVAPFRPRQGPPEPKEPMNKRDEYYYRDRMASARLKRAVVVSVVTHVVMISGAVGMARMFGGGPSVPSGFVMEFLAVGLPDAPEGIESTRVEGLPSGPPQGAPAPPAKAEPEKKEEPKPAPEPPKPDPPKPDPPKPDPPKADPPKPEPPKETKKAEPAKVAEKKPDPPKKEEPKKPDPPKTAEKKPDPPKRSEPAKPDPPKQQAKSESGLGGSFDVASLLDDDLKNVGPPGAKGQPGAGGLAGARVSTQAQVGYGDPNSTETGISQRGIPSVLGTWAKQVERQVLRFWREPGGVGRANKVAVAFWVDRNGNLLGEPQIVEPSSDASLDQSGVNAIRTAAPFPPLPQAFTGSRQQVIFIFRLA